MNAKVVKHSGQHPNPQTLVEAIRARTDQPVCVGFGISRPEHVAQVARMAEGAICASALLDHIGRLPAEERVAGTETFVRELREAADSTVDLGK